VKTPDEAPVGTVTTIAVPMLETITALLPFNLTVAPVKLEPVIVTFVRAAPEEFERLVILGASETAGTLAG
jgi:hypothetical protein